MTTLAQRHDIVRFERIDNAAYRIVSLRGSGLREAGRRENKQQN